MAAGASVDVDAAVAQQRAGRASELGDRLAVVGQRGDFGELRQREIVLPRQHEEVGAEPDAEAIAGSFCAVRRIWPSSFPIAATIICRKNSICN